MEADELRAGLHEKEFQMNHQRAESEASLNTLEALLRERESTVQDMGNRVVQVEAENRHREVLLESLNTDM